MPEKSILYIGTLPPFPGGTAVLCSQLLLGLAELGYEIRAFAPSTEAAERNPHPFAHSHPRLRVTKFLMPHHPVNSVMPLDRSVLESMRQNALTLLDRAMDKVPADVVLIGRESFLWGIPALAGSHALPCIQLAHAEASAIADGGFGDDFAGKLIAELGKVHRVVAVAHHLAEKLGLRGLRNLVTIPNPVDVDRFTPAPRNRELLRNLQIPEDAIIVMHPSNLKPGKRVPDVLASAVRTTAVDRRCYYVIVGGGAEQEELRGEAARLGVAGRCRFTGWVDHVHMPGYFQLADIVLMPSETEAMALAYLEAQASECLLLASEIPAAREVVSPGETGLLHPVGDIAALAEKTLFAAKDSALRRRVGKQARQRVIKTHALETIVAAYGALIEDVVAASTTRRGV